MNNPLCRQRWLSNRWPLFAGLWLLLLSVLCCAGSKLMGGPWL